MYKRQGLEKTGRAANTGAAGLVKVENMMESTQKRASSMNSTLKGLVGTCLLYTSFAAYDALSEEEQEEVDESMVMEHISMVYSCYEEA